MSVSSRPFPVGPPPAPATGEIVELTSLDAEDLEGLWEEERRYWKEWLYWDSEPATALVRAAIRRRRLPGKAVVAGGEVVGCGYYLVDHGRAILGSFILAKTARTSAMVRRLARGLLESVQSNPTVCRIETQFVPFELSSLHEEFLAAGFRVYERAFLRNDLERIALPAVHRSDLEFEPWTACHAGRAAALMQQAHVGSVDAEMNEMYRTQRGCRSLLDNVIDQQGCGRLVPAASFVLQRPRARGFSGFLLTTEISAGHAHLAQVAVSPSAQGLGLGRLLVSRAIDNLSRSGYRSVSLMVTETNQRALSLYGSMGFRPVVRFPVFSWDRLLPESRYG